VNIAAAAVVFFSILFPSKTWYAPSQPLEMTVKPENGAVSLVLTDFAGKPFDPKAPIEIASEQKVNLRDYFATLDVTGTYILYAVPAGKDLKEFVGTPLVIGVRSDKRPGGGASPPMVVKVEPLRYAVMSTDKGEMTMAFYYDVAPNTAASFLSLAEGGYFDGLAFHRIVPDFVIQGGDPKGDSSGGPGYQIDAEFSDRQHDVGVLSMAREGDALERQGAMPRPEFADSAGSQFFICLTREKTKQLDRRYTVFGKVTAGLDVVAAIGATPVGGANGDTPTERREIKSVKVLPVSAGNNPYDGLLTIAVEKKE
jgi:peptidyl-prolyl cis-trans isomerase B (cyclophilin B)